MKAIFFFFLFVLSINMIGQDYDFEENDQFSVRSVYFFSPTFPMTDGWIDVLKDNGDKYSFNNNYSTAYTYYGINPSPVAYVSNNVIKVGADLDIVLCGNETSLEDLIIKGVASNGFHFPPQQGVIFGDVLRYKMHASEETLENEKVQYFEEFKIEWYITSDPNALDPSLEETVEWALAGESQNPLYVTHKAPIAAIPGEDSDGNQYRNGIGYEWFESLLYLSCSNANNKSAKIDIFESIWSDFVDNSVTNSIQLDLNYYFHFIQQILAICSNTEMDNVIVGVRC